MSKKKALLGPDGKPLDLAKYRPKPKYTVSLNGEDITPQITGLHMTSSPMSAIDSWGRLFAIGSVTGTPPAVRPLRRAVEGQLAAIHDRLPEEWFGGDEMPPPPAHIADTYSAAYTSAVRHCDHSGSSHSTLYARGERQCDDCGRYFTRKNWWD